MALTITQPVLETFDPNITDGAGGFALLSAVQNNNQAAARLLGPRPYTFSAEGTSVGNEAVTLALLAPINLTALGVAFPAGSIRNIRVRCWSRRATTPALAGYSEKVYTVVGAATPTIPLQITVAAALAAVHEPQIVTRSPNNNSASAPEYGEGIVILDAVATTNVIVGVQNRLGTTNAATSATALRWRLEVLVEPLVVIALA